MHPVGAQPRVEFFNHPLMLERYQEHTVAPWSRKVLFTNMNDTPPGSYPPKMYDWLFWSIQDFEEHTLTDRDKGLLDNSSRRHIWKPFQHYKRVVGKSPGVVSLPVYTKEWGTPAHPYIGTVNSAYARYWSHSPTSGTGEPFGKAGEYSSGLTPFRVITQDGIIPKPAHLDMLHQLAMSHMLPRIKSELSAVNSLIELKDFASLPRTLANIGKLLLKGGLRRGLPLKQLVNVGADSYLQVKFNLQPLFRDIVGIVRSLSEHERQINALISRGNQRTVRHFTKVFTEFNDPTETWSGDYMEQPTYMFDPLCYTTAHRRVVYEPSVYHAQIEYCYTYTQYQRQHAAVLSLLDAIGINLNPAIIWNAIPWSFVIDWVFGVGRYLEQFQVKNMEPVIDIRQFLYSIKRERKIYVDVGVSPTPCDIEPVVNRQRFNLPVVTETAYGRWTDLPGLSSIQSSGLSLDEIKLGGALVFSRKGRPKPRKW